MLAKNTQSNPTPNLISYLCVLFAIPVPQLSKSETSSMSNHIICHLVKMSVNYHQSEDLSLIHVQINNNSCLFWGMTGCIDMHVYIMKS